MNSNEFLQKLKRFRRQSGSHIAEYNYRTVSSFIAGVDYADDGTHLQDFRGWLLEKYHLKSSFGWPRLVEHIYYDSLADTADENIVEFLFSNLYGYLREKPAPNA